MKRKEFNEEGKKIFEGEYLNGKKLKGIICEYYDNGFLKLKVNTLMKIKMV